MSEENNSWTIVLRDTLITWGVPLLVSSIPCLAWIDGVADFFRAVGWRFVVVLYSVLLFVGALLFIAWRKAKKREKVALAKLDDDFRTHLQVVENQGYAVDTRNGQAVCPKCQREKNVEIFMAFCDGEYPVHYCNACGCTIWKDGKARPRKKVAIVGL